MLTEKEIKNLNGLSAHEAAARIARDGYNELPSDKKRDVWHIFIGVMSEPMFILLIACSFIYFLLGDLHEASMLFGVIFIIIGIEIYQENRTEKALGALKNLSSPRALVIRDGEQKRVAGREVVKDDIVLLNEGDRIPADALLVWSLNLSIDESILTGESMPVKKIAADNPEIKFRSPSGENQPYVYSSTLVTSGQGVAVVKNTGITTEIGKIGKLLSRIEAEDTLLQRDTRKIVKNISLIGFFLCLLVVFFYWYYKGDLINGFLAGLTLAMGILPEEFPVVLTIFLSMGAWRISKKNVLARKMSAVETLGSATVLCVDKTGTLTKNQMSIASIYIDAKNRLYQVKEKDEADNAVVEIMQYAQMACKKEPFDPMEKAIGYYNNKVDTGNKYDQFLSLNKLAKEYPLTERLLALANVWQDQSGKNEYLVAVKGAPEAILDLCHLDEKKSAELNSVIIAMAKSGLRVLGVARAQFNGEVLPEHQHDYQFEFLGFLGLADPIREGVPEAIKHCYRAGIRVIMITGDYPETAISIAKQIGLKNSEAVILGGELEEINDLELVSKIKAINIFARVLPEQKLRIVEALKVGREVVAMTGDGVNDAPALKAANIGIAMGERGTDVSREAAAIVLLDDDFSSLVNGIRIGRKIFDNIMKAMSYIISVHIPIAGLSLIPLIFKWPIIFFPVHIVFLELVVDPVCSVLFENEPAEKNIMERQPRDPKKSIFNREMLGKSIMQGVMMMIIFVAVFRATLLLGFTAEIARTITFTTLVFSNIALIFSSRSKYEGLVTTIDRKNKALWFIITGTLLFLTVTIYIPGLREIFRFAALNFYQIMVALICSILTIVWSEISKRKMI